MKIFFIIIFLFISIFSFSQIPEDTLQVEENLKKDTIFSAVPKSETKIVSNIELQNNPEYQENNNKTDEQTADTPSKTPKLNATKAGLYSAVLPGLGQFYNKKYWKIPIVWGAVGTGVGIAIWNENQYKRYRTAFVAELNGLPHEFSDIPGVTADALGRVQDRAKRQRDYAIAITGLIYVLNIVDAVVDAHLYEGKHDPDLTLQPTVIYDEFALQNTKPGLSLRLKF
ncbi:MAG: DUF5683 domain-containing protein [Flavobacteriaceae bacterium]|jgi:hypothetical protein|nr:DUF5683 domain-containing protein [Flavobacteriaceae bacterium]